MPRGESFRSPGRVRSPWRRILFWGVYVVFLAALVFGGFRAGHLEFCAGEAELEEAGVEEAYLEAGGFEVCSDLLEAFGVHAEVGFAFARAVLGSGGVAKFDPLEAILFGEGDGVGFAAGDFIGEHGES